MYAYYAHPPTERLTATGVTLNIHWHTGTWYYKRTAGTPADTTCRSVTSGTTATLTSLTTNTAYTTSGCAAADEIASTAFTTS